MALRRKGVEFFSIQSVLIRKDLRASKLTELLNVVTACHCDAAGCSNCLHNMYIYVPYPECSAVIPADVAAARTSFPDFPSIIGRRGFGATPNVRKLLSTRWTLRPHVATFASEPVTTEALTREGIFRMWESRAASRYERASPTLSALSG